MISKNDRETAKDRMCQKKIKIRLKFRFFEKIELLYAENCAILIRKSNNIGTKIRTEYDDWKGMIL